MLNKTIAKRVDNDQWVQGCYFKTPITSEVNDSKPSDGWFFLSGKPRHCIARDCCVFEVYPTTVRKYAGTTKGGQEVHEGSIVSMDGFKGVVKWADGSEGHGVSRDEYPIGFVVEWEEKWWRPDLGFWLNEREITVIGNVHDNLELVEGV